MFNTPQEVSKVKDFIKITDYAFYKKRKVEYLTNDKPINVYNVYTKTLLYNNKDGYYTLELLRKKMREISQPERKKVAYYIDTLFREINSFYNITNENKEDLLIYIKKRKTQFQYRFNHVVILDLQTRFLMEELTNSVFSVLKKIVYKR